MVVSTPAEIETRISDFVSEVFLAGNPKARVTPKVSLLGSRIIDSLGVLEMIEFMENEFGITVEEADMTPDNLDSIEKISRYVYRKIEGED